MKKLILLPLIVFLSIMAYSQPGTPTETIDGNLQVLGKTILEDVSTGPYDSALVKAPDGTIYKRALSEVAANLPERSGTILRLPYVGLTVTDYTADDLYAWQLYAPPTISCNISGSIFEVGTRNSITISGSTSNPDNMSNGRVTSTGATSPLTPTFGSDASYSYNITYIPKQVETGNDYEDHSYTFRAYQDYDGTETGTASSSTVSMNSYFATLVGISSTDYTTLNGNQAYLDSDFTHYLYSTNRVITQDFTGTGYMQIIVPNNWGDNIDVRTSTGTVIAGFTQHTVNCSSSGLDDDYLLEGYECWIGPTSGTYSGQTYLITITP